MNQLMPLVGNTTKTTIIEILAEKPLTLKELHNRIQKALTKQISYQAVHKTIIELITEGILIKTPNKRIQINNEWLENVGEIIEQLKNTTKDTQKQNEESTIKTYHLYSFAEAGKFVIRTAHDSENPDNKPSLCMFRHSWPLFGMTKPDYDILNETIKKGPWFELIRGNTNLDKIFAKPLQDMGKLIVHDAKTTAPFDIIIKGNYVQQIIFPSELVDKLDDIYSKCKSLDDFSIVNLLKDFVVEKNTIIVKVVKDKNLADNIRQEAIKEALKHKKDASPELIKALEKFIGPNPKTVVQ